MPGARCTRSPVCSVESTRVVATGRTGTPGIPARNGFNGLLRALPGDDFAVRSNISRPHSVNRSQAHHPPCNPVARKTLPRPPFAMTNATFS